MVRTSGVVTANRKHFVRDVSYVRPLEALI